MERRGRGPEFSGSLRKKTNILHQAKPFSSRNVKRQIADYGQLGGVAIRQSCADKREGGLLTCS